MATKLEKNLRWLINAVGHKLQNPIAIAEIIVQMQVLLIVKEVI